MVAKKDIKKEIIKAYSNNLLIDKNSFKTIYELCVKLEIEETEFYQYFTSFKDIEKEILKNIIDSSLSVLKTSPEFETYDTKNKLLSFYFTFFETLTLNRSIVLYLINSNPNKLEQLKKIETFKPAFIEFIHELNINFLDVSSDNIQKIQEKTIHASAWTQLLLTFKFWMDDKSKGFEKTDIFIEKSISTGFNLLNNDTLNSLLDFGKFIWKEKVIKTKS
ncbi:MAG: TetR family transcriptional regulator C-terminal domain-containing protein [Solirubrobacteraceae bacterium]